MRYATAAAFRQALDARLKTEAAMTELGLARLRRRVAFELFLRRLVVVAPDRWVLKGRWRSTSASTRPPGPHGTWTSAVPTTSTPSSKTLAPPRSSFSTTSSRLPYGEPTLSTKRTTSGGPLPRHRPARGPHVRSVVVDVGFADSISWTPDTIETSDLLSFAGIQPIQVPALPLAQHLAEKLHAYTRKYGPSGRESTRPKHLIDILLIARSESLAATDLRNALEATFGQRELQRLPTSLPSPPPNWLEPHRRLATGLDVEAELDRAFAAAAAFLDPMLAGQSDGVWDPRRKRWT